jgi:predicted phage gp36 major capsid-like protein
LPDIAANSLSIACGDFNHLVVDRGGVQDFSAIKPMKFAAS